MAATRISNAAAIAACDAIVDLVDAAAGSPNSGRVEIRDGAQPADPDTAATGNALATFFLPNPAFGNAADAAPGGRATANSIDTVAASLTGTAAWFRVFDGDGTAIWDGDVTVTSGGGDMEINSVAISAGADVQITSWTVTMPET